MEDKSKKIQYLEKILRFMAQAVLWKYKPQVVGITGSIGKTSAKEAVFAALSPHFRVRKNEKNYNNEIGLPLTIIGVESGNRSILKWLKVFLKWLGVMIFPVRYPKVLVLEMGVDHPGDMDYLLSFIKPTIGIVTGISSSHLEFFSDLDHIAEEKGKLIAALPKNGMALLNGDDARTAAMAKRTEAEVLKFGFGEKGEIKASNESFVYKGERLQGISFKLEYDGKTVPVRLSQIVAPHLIYAALAGAGVGIYFKINLVAIGTALQKFQSPPGRMRLIPAVKNGFLIDDSYNASPTSVGAALKVLEKIKAPRKIVALGDMLELGMDSESGHNRVAREVFEMGADIFVAVGNRMKKAAKEAALHYMTTKVFYFDDPESAGRFLQTVMKYGDLVLIKGSQGMRMEKAAEEIVADQQRLIGLLCRQSADWKKKLYSKP